MRSSDQDALNDLARNIAYLRGLSSRLSLDMLRGEDPTLFYATTRALEIISKASRRLSLELISRWPDVPWPQIKAAGNVYLHEYQRIPEDFVLAAATIGLDALETAVTAELAAMDKAQ